VGRRGGAGEQTGIGAQLLHECVDSLSFFPLAVLLLLQSVVLLGLELLNPQVEFGFGSAGVLLLLDLEGSLPNCLQPLPALLPVGLQLLGVVLLVAGQGVEVDCSSLVGDEGESLLDLLLLDLALLEGEVLQVLEERTAAETSGASLAALLLFRPFLLPSELLAIGQLAASLPPLLLQLFQPSPPLFFALLSLLG
jgi:hypothetical protein